MERVILHSDLNSFYASVEIALNPELRRYPVAVSGSVENRQGVVLARSEVAKRVGISTGMTTVEAMRLCPDLVIIPPHFDEYIDYSHRVRSIYERYTDMVEAFGIDECWMDVSRSSRMSGGGTEIADSIRQSVAEELRLSVSIGVSFNKIFAKLGSDLKKPNAVTVIPRESFRSVIWTLPSNRLLYVGRSTERTLHRYGIHSIGDIARSDAWVLRKLLGVNGEQLWRVANGMDNSEVRRLDYIREIKSISRGITCSKDVQSDIEVYRVIVFLAEQVAEKLRAKGLMAGGVQIAVKDKELRVKQYQNRLEVPTQSFLDISRAAYDCFLSSYQWTCDVRAISVRATKLTGVESCYQHSVFDSVDSHLRRDILESAVMEIKGAYGYSSVLPARVLGADNGLRVGERSKMPTFDFA